MRLDADGSRAWAVQGDECSLGENIFYLATLRQCKRSWSEITIKEKNGRESHQFIKSHDP